ncbi:hypothetical protein [Tardiphaga sp.]|uniref:hypothetical protein n=1 Tax=Tardiphaga sp. TaxID=1926292 RepID=UPI002608A87A|nr:hypothetical protein [Tardiphaga sp.]
MARTQTFDQRAAILSGLLRRNRLVGFLRVAIPAAGVATFLILMGQLWLSNFARQYGVSGIRIDRGQLVVETPQYSEIGDDGSRYLVTAREARAPLSSPDNIDMIEPHLTFERPEKAPFHAVAATASVNTSTHYVVAPGVTTVHSDDGLSGTLTDVHANMAEQLTTAEGPVDLTFSDGSHLTAANMNFDGKADLWSFDQATLVVPNLPKPHPYWGNVFLLFAPAIADTSEALNALGAGSE